MCLNICHWNVCRIQNSEVSGRARNCRQLIFKSFSDFWNVSLILLSVFRILEIYNVRARAELQNRIRELCRLARVYVCYDEGTMGDDPNEWCLSRLDELCRCEKFEQSCDAESEGAC